MVAAPQWSLPDPQETFARKETGVSDRLTPKTLGSAIPDPPPLTIGLKKASDSERVQPMVRFFREFPKEIRECLLQRDCGQVCPEKIEWANLRPHHHNPLAEARL